MRKVRVAVLVLLVLVVTGCGGGAFKTPEDAITSYLEGVVESDVDKILQACAIDEMSENFQFDDWVEWLRGLLLQDTLSPVDYPLYVEINRVQQTYRILQPVRNLVYSLLASEVQESGLAFIEMDGRDATHFVKDVDPERLRSLEVEEIDVPAPEQMGSDRYQENAEELASIYGADEMTERVVLVSFEDEYYVLGFTLLRYGKSWKISAQYSALGSAMGGIGGTGIAEPITEDEFESLTDGP